GGTRWNGRPAAGRPRPGPGGRSGEATRSKRKDGWGLFVAPLTWRRRWKHLSVTVTRNTLVTGIHTEEGARRAAWSFTTKVALLIPSTGRTRPEESCLTPLTWSASINSATWTTRRSQEPLLIGFLLIKPWWNSPARTTRPKKRWAWNRSVRRRKNSPMTIG